MSLSLLFDILQAVGSGATAAAVFFLWNQSKQTQQQLKYTREELDLNLRSWIAVKHVETVLSPDNSSVLKELRFHIIAYGKIPPKVIRIKGGFQYEPSPEMTKDSVKNGNPIVKKTFVYPNVENYQAVKRDRFDKVPEFVGIQIEYETTQKIYEYGCIRKRYLSKINYDTIVEECAT